MSWKLLKKEGESIAKVVNNTPSSEFFIGVSGVSTPYA